MHLSRINKRSETKFCDTQLGFRKMKSTSDDIFILYSIKKSYPKRREKNLVFQNDYDRAFDTIDRDFYG